MPVINVVVDHDHFELECNGHAVTVSSLPLHVILIVVNARGQLDRIDADPDSQLRFRYRGGAPAVL